MVVLHAPRRSDLPLLTLFCVVALLPQLAYIEVLISISETISTWTSPIITPIWNTVGRPAWHYVGRPITSLVSSILSVTLLLITQPIRFVATSVGRTSSWLWHQAVSGEVADNITYLPAWLWRKVEYVTWQFVLLDAWMFKR